MKAKDTECNLTLQQLREALDYNSDTGELRWKIAPSGRRDLAGKLAGSVSKRHGYRRITLAGGRYLAHRLAWLFVYGEWPTCLVDHINIDRADNRIANLRLATNSQNKANGAAYEKKSKLPKGVYVNCAGKFGSQMKFRGKHFHLGTYDTKEAAHMAYIFAAKERFGEFASNGTRKKIPRKLSLFSFDPSCYLSMGT